MPLRWTAAGLVPYSYDSSDDEEEDDSDPPCDVCANLDRKMVPKWSRSGDHYFTIRNIRPSAIKSQHGICELCTIICSGINCFRAWSTLKDDESRIHIMAYDDSTRPLIVWLARATDAPFGAQGPAELVIELYTDNEDETSSWPAIGTSQHISKDPTCDLTFELISEWIDECTNDHPLCQPRSDITLPSRVIDVGSDDCAPKLYISNRESDPYVALSHCWGDSLPLTTTTKTISSHTDGIAWDRLPKTFREAIIVTRKLGLKYLWIDSLCIIQDDPHDWEIESTHMASVYQNSYITIASTGFPNSGGGLLEPRKSYRMELEGKYVFAREYLDHEQFAAEGFGCPGDTWMSSLQYPLFTRGWCFQERLLSARVLHYTPAGIFFECGWDAWCECQCDPEAREVRSFKWKFPRGLMDTTNARVNARADVEVEIRPNARFDPPAEAGASSGTDSTYSDYNDDSDCTVDGPSTQWDNIIKNYTRKNLSYQNDALPALSGLASEWQHMGLGKYLAGLWEHELATGLLWTSDKSVPEKFQSDGYMAPTFSWASRVGPITLFDACESHTLHIEILEAECTPKGYNPFGQVIDGFVRIRGPLIEAEFHPGDCRWCATMFWQKLNGACHLRKLGYEAEYFNIDRATDAEIKKGEVVYLLLVATMEQISEESTDEEEDWDQSANDDRSDEDTDSTSSNEEDSKPGGVPDEGSETTDSAEEPPEPTDLNDGDSEATKSNDNDSDMPVFFPPSRHPKDGDVGNMMRKSRVSHSAALILQHTGDRNRYKRIGAAHKIDDGWFKKATKKEIVIL